MIGKTVSHYQILEHLGGGGMGDVYKAYDTRLKRNVALKFLTPELSHNEEAKSRFMREAQAASALDHPNICNVHEIDQTEDGQMFICMTLYEGNTLRNRMQEGPVPIDEVLNISMQIAQGLAIAHDAGISHRDLKPANIMLNRQGELKIVDFGLAKLSNQQDLTKESSTIGTVAYMSPEQAKGQPTDHRTDIWSFGVILYELLTCQRPFRGDYDQAIIYSILNENPEPIHKSAEDTPIELINIVTRCLMKDPKDRYSAMDDIVLILQHFQQGSNSVNEFDVFSKIITAFHKLKTYRIPLVGIFVILIILFSVWDIFFTLSSPRYLVVLPLRIIGEESIDDIYIDGLLEIVNSKLTQLEHFQDKIWIISGSEVRNNNITSVAEAFNLVGADLAITGSITQKNNSYRYTLNLVETESFRQLKSKDFWVEGKIASIVEEKIVDHIVQMLNFELGEENRNLLYAGGTKIPDAHDYYVRGRGYLTHSEDQKNIETAISLFELALTADSTYLLAHAGLGEAYWKKYVGTRDLSFIELAKLSCFKAMKLEDKHAEVNITCGIIFRGIGEYERSEEVLLKALSLDPDNISASLELGFSYFLQGKNDLSLKLFQTVVHNRPGYWQGHSYLGYYYYVTADYDNALVQYKIITELLPNSDIGYNRMASVLFQMNRIEEAIQTAEMALERKESYSTYNNLAAFYYYIGDYEKAAIKFKEVLAYNKLDYLVYGNLATANYFTGKKDSALVNYKKAVELAEKAREINPRNNLLLTSLAGYYARLDSSQISYRLLNEVENLNPKNLEVIFNIGDVYEQLGNRTSALIWMEKALRNGYSLAKFKMNPGLQSLISDKRFKDLVSQIEKL